MTPDVLKLRVRFHQLALLDALEDWLHQVSVFDRLSVGRHPVVAPPIDEPLRQAFDRVLTIGHDEDVSIARCNLNRPLAGRQFRALIGLATFQSLRHIPKGQVSLMPSNGRDLNGLAYRGSSGPKWTPMPARA